MDTSQQDSGKRWFEGLKRCPHVVLSQMFLLMVCFWTIYARKEIAVKLKFFFDSMIRKGIKPNVTIYAIMLHGYGNKGALSEMHDLLSLMVANGISPDHYMHMLKGQ